MAQEHFRACSDITITGSGSNPTPAPPGPTTSAPPAPTTTTVSSCSDNVPTKRCEKWKSQGKCSKNWVLKKCPQTCDNCNPTEAPCVDTESATKCNKWKSKGKCSKKWVIKKCPQTCGTCTPTTTAAPPPPPPATTTAAAPAPPAGNICSDPFGYYANPQDSECQSYVQCAHGTPHVIPCPAGTVYNPNTIQCVWAWEYQCPGNGGGR